MKSTLIGFLSCRIPKDTLEKINEILVKIFLLERNSESRVQISDQKLNTILEKTKPSVNQIFTLITDKTIQITSSITKSQITNKKDSYKIYKTLKSDFSTTEIASFRLKNFVDSTKLFKRLTLTKHNYGASDELSELKDTINYCRNSGIKNLIISGAFSHNGPNPTTVIDRAYIKFASFREVLTQAKLQGIKIILEFETKVGTRFPSKKYRGRFLKVNHNGEVTHLKYGIGLSGKIDDMYCLNYSDYENWKLTSGELKYVLNKFRGLVGGICIKDIGLMPLIFQRDFEVLGRKELDGGWTYSEKLKQFGYVVNCDPYYYGSNFNKESQNAFLKFLSTEIRNTTLDNDFVFFDDSDSVDQTGSQEFIKELNSNGIHPLIRGMSLSNEKDHSLSNFQKNFEIQKKWIKSGLDFTFVYDSTQPLTKSTFANLMTILLGHSHCIYESNYINNELTIVQCNTEVDNYTRLSMIRRVPRSNPISEPEFVNQSRYLYIYDILTTVLRDTGKDNLSMLFCFKGHQLCESSIGFYSEKNTELIIANTNAAVRQVVVNLNDVLRILLRKENINSDFSSRKMFLNVKNIKKGQEDLYDFNEVLDNGLILEFGVRIFNFLFYY